MARVRVGIIGLAAALAVLGGALLGETRGAAQQDSPPRPSHIHQGDCDELGPVIQPLTSLQRPGGAVRGNSEAVVAEAAFSNIPLTLDQMLDGDHALKVHASKERIDVYLACGDIGGELDGDGALIVGLKELDDSGYTGIAYLVPAGNGTTNISVMIAEVLPGGEAPAAAAEEAAAPQAEAVDVSLTEFAIDMPTALRAGPVRFNVANDGAAPHSFVIEGEGIAESLTANLPPGASSTLQLDLAPGSYVVYCPVGQGAHRARGMEVQLTVA